MMRSIPVAICLIMLVGLAQPAVAQTGSGKVFEPFTVGPDTSTYTVHAKIDGGIEPGCTTSLAEINGNYTGGGEVPVMVNNPNDPCITDEYPGSPGNYQNSVASHVGPSPMPAPEQYPERPGELPEDAPYPSWPSVSREDGFTIYSAMKVPAGHAFVQGAKMGGELYLWVDSSGPTQGTTPNLAGLAPRVSLVLHNQTLATWQSDGDAISQVDPGAGTDRAYFKFDVDWGETPTEPAKYGGSLRVVIRFSTPQEGVGMLFGVSTVEEHRSTLTIPFTQVALPEEDSDNETSDNNTTEMPDNNTTDMPDDNNTTVPDSNETVDPGNNTTGEAPEEKGFLPGFETIGVLVAGALAVARYDRMRRRPPGRVGS